MAAINQVVAQRISSWRPWWCGGGVVWWVSSFTNASRHQLWMWWRPTNHVRYGTTHYQQMSQLCGLSDWNPLCSPCFTTIMGRTTQGTSPRAQALTISAANVQARRPCNHSFHNTCTWWCICCAGWHVVWLLYSMANKATLENSVARVVACHLTFEEFYFHDADVWFKDRRIKCRVFWQKTRVVV